MEVWPHKPNDNNSIKRIYETSPKKKKVKRRPIKAWTDKMRNTVENSGIK